MSCVPHGMGSLCRTGDDSPNRSSLVRYLMEKLDDLSAAIAVATSDAPDECSQLRVEGHGSMAYRADKQTILAVPSWSATSTKWHSSTPS